MKRILLGLSAGAMLTASTAALAQQSKAPQTSFRVAAACLQSPVRCMWIRSELLPQLRRGLEPDRKRQLAVREGRQVLLLSTLN
jgi:hypothetical protein